MDKLFLDSDVIIDVLAQREGFYKSAAILLSLGEKKKIRCFTSPIVLANIYYVISKVRTRSYAKRSIAKLRNFIEVANLDSDIIDLAIESNFTDFEDAIQYYCALKNETDALITRNKRDYKRTKLPILNPEEYLNQMNSQN